MGMNRSGHTVILLNGTDIYISWALWNSENVQLSILLGWKMVGRHPTIFCVNAEPGFLGAIKTEANVWNVLSRLCQKN